MPSTCMLQIRENVYVPAHPHRRARRLVPGGARCSGRDPFRHNGAAFGHRQAGLPFRSGSSRRGQAVSRMVTTRPEPGSHEPYGKEPRGQRPMCGRGRCSHPRCGHRGRSREGERRGEAPSRGRRIRVQVRVAPDGARRAFFAEYGAPSAARPRTTRTRGRRRRASVSAWARPFGATRWTFSTDPQDPDARSQDDVRRGLERYCFEIAAGTGSCPGTAP